MVIPARETRTFAGVMLMALAVVCFTGIDTSAKWLVGAGLAVGQVVFTRFFGHFVIACLLFVPREGRAAFHSAHPRKQALRSMFLFGGTAFNFTALQYLPITLTTTMFFAVPIVVTLLAVPVLGEQVGLRRILAVCAGFLGVLIVVQPGNAAFHPAIALSVCALLCASMYFIMTRKLAGLESDAVSQLWPSGLASLLFLPVALWSWVWPPSMLDWSVMIVLGAFGVVGHILTVTAHRFADASILSPVVYLQLFTATAVGLWVFGTPPSRDTLWGSLVIIASGLYIWQRERTKRR